MQTLSKQLTHLPNKGWEKAMIKALISGHIKVKVTQISMDQSRENSRLAYLFLAWDKNTIFLNEERRVAVNYFNISNASGSFQQYLSDKARMLLSGGDIH